MGRTPWQRVVLGTPSSGRGSTKALIITMELALLWSLNCCNAFRNPLSASMKDWWHGALLGTEHLVCSKVTVQHGVGEMNHNGLRLLSLCAEHQLVITNTIFHMKNRLKSTWQHPRSKHCHLLDYVIVHQKDRQDVLTTCVMRGPPHGQIQATHEDSTMGYLSSPLQGKSWPRSCSADW